MATAATMKGGDEALQTYETTFKQDLNGDGRIGPPPRTVIEQAGVTSLVRSGIFFFGRRRRNTCVREVSSGVCSSVVGQFGAWLPIGAEQVTGGYRVAWSDGAN